MNAEDDRNYQSKKQRRLFLWTLVAVFLFVIAWNADTFSQLFGLEPTHGAGDNFIFLFPVMTVSLVILCLTGGLTIINWRKLPNKTISIITIILSFYLISSIAYTGIMLLRQH